MSDRRHHPIFQVLFNYLDVPRRTVELPRLRLGERFTCYFTYNTDLFEAPTVALRSGEALG